MDPYTVIYVEPSAGLNLWQFFECHADNDEHAEAAVEMPVMVTGGAITNQNLPGRFAVNYVVDLRGRSIPIDDDELVENLARFADGTLTEGQVKARHHLSNEDWLAMGESDRLVELVEACKLRRIRSGATKREKAQIEVVDAPPIC